MLEVRLVMLTARFVIGTRRGRRRSVIGTRSTSAVHHSHFLFVSSTVADFAISFTPTIGRAAAAIIVRILNHHVVVVVVIVVDNDLVVITIYMTLFIQFVFMRKTSIFPYKRSRSSVYLHACV